MEVADALVGITCAEAAGTSPTPDVTFAYDSKRNRLASFSDGSGATSYTYHPVPSPPTLGAGKLATIDGPLANDTIAYGYDELGRVVTRSINGAANLQTVLYGEHGQPTSITNLLGTFTYSYDPASGQPTGIAYPNGQSVSYDYYDLLGDRRLREIHNRYPGGATLSRFEYTYDRAANVATWLQQADSDPPVQYTYGYDATDQLTSAILRTTDPTPQVLKRYYYAYDPVGNRTAEQIDDTVRSWTHNSMNQLVTEQAGGDLLFRGTTDEPALVTVGGAPATTAADNTFTGSSEVVAGTSQVTVTARDFAQPPNTRTNVYEVTQAGASRSFTFDANGNMTSDGTRTYEWDAENRLTSVVVGMDRTEFSYDAFGRRVRETHRHAGGIESDVHFIRCSTATCEERATPGEVPFRTYFVRGYVEASTPAFVATDWLNNVREVTTSNGSLAIRFDYDSYGSRTRLAGAADSPRGYTGHETLIATQLQLTHFRVYDPESAHWLSEDRVLPTGSRSAFAYADGRPLRLVDRDGAEGHSPDFLPMCPIGTGAMSGGGAQAGIPSPGPFKRLWNWWECRKPWNDCNDEAEKRCTCKFKERRGIGMGGLEWDDVDRPKRQQCFDQAHDCCNIVFGACMADREGKYMPPPLKEALRPGYCNKFKPSPDQDPEPLAPCP